MTCVNNPHRKLPSVRNGEVVREASNQKRHAAESALHAFAGEPAGAEGRLEVVAPDGAVKVEDFSGEV
jgi:hypothetical protein